MDLHIGYKCKCQQNLIKSIGLIWLLTVAEGHSSNNHSHCVNGGDKVGRVGGRLLSIGDLIVYRLPSFIGL